MLRLLQDSHKTRALGVLQFGPFNSSIQQRWNKPVDSAQTRLENRTRDHKLDKLMLQIKNLNVILKLHQLMSKAKKGYTSIQIISRWRNIVGINTPIGEFLGKYPDVFEVFNHPVKKNVCCRVSEKFCGLVVEDNKVMKECELDAVQMLKRLLMMSNDGALHIHALWLLRRELGLPDDFRDSVILKYADVFSVVDPDIVTLVNQDEHLGVAEVEKWREKEFKEKWLSEYETRFAFPIHLPTGFKIEAGFREKLKNWQRLSYIKPYEKIKGAHIRINSRGVEGVEKRAVGVLHEFLSLTVEKLVAIERLSHFRRDLYMGANIRELLLKHPGIFYISTRGGTQTVFLREAYSKGCLIEPNPIYAVRRKMLDLVSLRSRNMRGGKPLDDEMEKNELLASMKFQQGERCE